ncbi:MAG: transglutaminase-like domain-containing protein [Crocinitomicaceae bacterium]|nr:transglutaminase-like domain-containing protein [Crocinitomicaceae bacterium]
MLSIQSVQALIQLIDDPDDHVYEHVHDQLKSFGSEAIPYLEESWEYTTYGLLFQNRVENLIHEIQVETIHEMMKAWIYSEEKDLLEGALILCRYQYPGIDTDAVKLEIERIRKAIWIEMNPNQTSFEKIKTFNHVFFEQNCFEGDSKNYHSPLNSFVNTVLQARKGNPLTLSLIYSVIAQSLKLPVYGVNLPNHFVLAYMDEHAIHASSGKESPYGVLFYINPFSKGSIIQEADIQQFIAKLNLKERREYFEPCPNTQIIKRMILNLMAAFQQSGNVRKVNELSEIKKLFDQYQL